MGFITTLATRFLTGRKRNTFLSFIAAVSLFGVALGVSALVVVMGVMEGFENELRSIITGTHSHIVLYSSSVISNRAELQSRIENKFPEQISAISPFVFSEVMLAREGRVVGAMLEGIQDTTAALATNLERHLMQKTYPAAGFYQADGKPMRLPTIVLGSVVAEKLAAKIGDEISVISPFFDKGSLQPRIRKFTLAGMLSTGMYEYDSKYCLVHVDEAVDFFRLPFLGASALKIKTKDPQKSYLTAAAIRRELGTSYTLRDWTELNRNLLYAIKLQKAVIFIVLSVIIIVAAFNIMSTLVMLMSEKKREISILQAMGMSPGQSARVFISLGLIIGVAGAVAGLSIGLMLSGVLARTRFIHLPPDVYFISYLPVDINISTLLLIAATSTLIAMGATLYPAWRAARVPPVEGLRYE